MDWNEVLEIRSQITALDAKRRDALARLDAAALRHLGLSIGDRIIVTMGPKDFEAVVTGVDSAMWSDRPRPTAVKVKKDGTAGEASAGYIREWRKKDEAQP